MSANDEPVQVEVQQDGLVPWERALTIIKNVLVIITCLVILYIAWRGYVALSALQDGLRDVQDTFGGGSGG